MKAQFERMPSEIIEDFITLLKYSQQQYNEAQEQCEALDSTVVDKKWAHRFEFANDKSERNRLATAYQKERRKRRDYKNMVDLYKTINDFSCSENNKSTLKRLTGMLNVQKRQEEYLQSDRKYKDGDSDDSN